MVPALGRAVTDLEVHLFLMCDLWVEVGEVERLEIVLALQTSALRAELPVAPVEEKRACG